MDNIEDVDVQEIIDETANFSARFACIYITQKDFLFKYSEIQNVYNLIL